MENLLLEKFSLHGISSFHGYLYAHLVTEFFACIVALLSKKLCSHFQGISTTPLLQLVLVIGAELYKCFVVMKRVKAIKKRLLN